MAMTSTLQTLEGIIGAVSYHYDVVNDVLYLRRLDRLNAPVLGEETDEGLIEERDESTGALVGLTAISFWKRFGAGPLPDSVAQITRSAEPLAKRIAA